MDARNAACAEVSFDALARLMNLPVGVEITGVSWDPSRDAIRLRLVGPGLPLVRPGELLQEVRPKASLHSVVLMEWPTA